MVINVEHESSPALLLSRDLALIRPAQALAAAQSSSLVVAGDVEEARAWWRRASSVIIGEDMLGEQWSLPARDRTYLVGGEPSAELCRWSAPLGASVLCLSDGNAGLARALGSGLNGSGSGPVIVVAGGSGGVGASTLCAGICIRAAASGEKVALVDGDPRSGGVDLLMGAEQIAGWRWPKLVAASGQLSDISDMLPTVDGVTVLSHARQEVLNLPDEARRAVVESLARSHRFVIVDAGRCSWWDMADKGILVAGQSVRAVAAAKVGVSETHSCGLVVRRTTGVSPAQLSKVLGLDLIGTVPTVKDVVAMGDRGIPPGLGGRWGRAMKAITAWCLPSLGASPGGAL